MTLNQAEQHIIAETIKSSIEQIIDACYLNLGDAKEALIFSYDRIFFAYNEPFELVKASVEGLLESLVDEQEENNILTLLMPILNIAKLCNGEIISELVLDKSSKPNHEETKFFASQMIYNFLLQFKEICELKDKSLKEIEEMTKALIAKLDLDKADNLSLPLVREI